MRLLYKWTLPLPSPLYKIIYGRGSGATAYAVDIHIVRVTSKMVLWSPSDTACHKLVGILSLLFYGK